ncbi:MAG: hypothetical protein EA393_06450 [Bacteroidetes bacterium]|nr:MAG: hypothetical protein EA393_06450 [Bacteroidota bacterium]
MKRITLLALGLVLIFSGCQKDAETEYISSDPVHPRISLKNQKIPVVPGFGLKTDPGEIIGYEFTLVAEVDAPVVDDQVVQATHVEIVGNWAFVSYNMRGSQHLGAIDIIDITNPANPLIIHTVEFDDKDVNTVGWYDGLVVIAGQNAEGAYYGFYDMDKDSTGIHSLLSFSAMSMKVSDDLIHVVSGDTGGLSLIDITGVTDYFEFTDARSVAVHDDIFILTSSGIFNLTGGSTAIPSGYLQTGSKADLDITDCHLFAAVNRGGVYILNPNDLSVIQTLSKPIAPEGMDAEDFVSNSVSFNELLFIADGGAGIRVAGQSENEFIEYGYFDFGGPLSSNFVKSAGNYVFVATGLGGLKILTFEEVYDDCTWTPETAFGGSEPGGGPAWWYYIDNSVEIMHPIYAGQELIEGAYITIGRCDNDVYVTLTIELGENMMLRDVSEPVKIQGYNEDNLPSTRPPAGLFTTYKGNELVVEVPHYPYYVVHLDVKVCN